MITGRFCIILYWERNLDLGSMCVEQGDTEGLCRQQKKKRKIANTPNPKQTSYLLPNMQHGLHHRPSIPPHPLDLHLSSHPLTTLLSHAPTF